MVSNVKVFVNGTFDVLHPGHINLLKAARKLGNYLLVGIDTDTRVKEKKGSDRPFNDQNNRKYILENIKWVDEVKLFGTDDELKNLIKTYQPDIMMVGSDWKGKNIIGSEYAKRLIFFDRERDFSTTKIIESFIDRRQLY